MALSQTLLPAVSDALDWKVLGAIERVLGAELPDEAHLLRDVWRDRQLLVDAAQKIRYWDMGHSEALSVERVFEVLDQVLHEIGEE